MTLRINNIDYSNYIQQKTDVIETPEYINGVSAGKITLSGKKKFERITRKLNPSFRLRPLPEIMLRSIETAVSGGVVELTYTSLYGERTIKAEGKIDRIQYGMTLGDGTRIFYDAVVSFEEE